MPTLSIVVPVYNETQLPRARPRARRAAAPPARWASRAADRLRRRLLHRRHRRSPSRALARDRPAAPRALPREEPGQGRRHPHRLRARPPATSCSSRTQTSSTTPASTRACSSPSSTAAPLLVFGSRFIGETHRVLYFWHSLGNQLLTFMSNMFTNLNFTDMEVCYKVFRREIIQQITIEENRFGIEPEFTAKVASTGVRLYEVPVSYSTCTCAEGKEDQLEGRRLGVALHPQVQPARLIEGRRPRPCRPQRPRAPPATEPPATAAAAAPAGAAGRAPGRRSSQSRSWSRRARSRYVRALSIADLAGAVGRSLVAVLLAVAPLHAGQPSSSGRFAGASSSSRTARSGLRDRLPVPRLPRRPLLQHLPSRQRLRRRARAHVTRASFEEPLGSYMVVLLERFFGLAGLFSVGAIGLLWHPLPRRHARRSAGHLRLRHRARHRPPSPILGRSIGRKLPGRAGAWAANLPQVVRPALLGVVLLLSLFTHTCWSRSPATCHVHALAPQVLVSEPLVLVPLAMVATYVLLRQVAWPRRARGRLRVPCSAQVAVAGADRDHGLAGPSSSSTCSSRCRDRRPAPPRPAAAGRPAPAPALAGGPDPA